MSLSNSKIQNRYIAQDLQVYTLKFMVAIVFGERVHGCQHVHKQFIVASIFKEGSWLPVCFERVQGCQYAQSETMVTSILRENMVVRLLFQFRKL